MIKKEYYNNGKLKFEYEIKNGKIEGFYRKYYENGQLEIETNYKNGERDGLYKEYYESGKIRSEFYYIGNQRYGLFKRYFENGKLEDEGSYKEDKKDGFYRSYYENGQINCDEIYKDGKRNGLCRKYYESGQLWEEINRKDEIKDGLCRIYYSNGQLKEEANYKDGKEEGFIKRYYSNGQLKEETNCKEGKGHNFSKEYYENGQLKYEAEFIIEELSYGFEKSYYINGQLKTESNYNKEEVCTKYYYEDGSLKFERKILCATNYRDEEAYRKEYYNNGVLRSEYKYTYKTEKKSGVRKIYRENGNLNREEHYKDGETILLKEYDENGKLEIEEYYKNGETYIYKLYKYSIENEEEIIKIYTLISIHELPGISGKAFQEDFINTSQNITTRRNYLNINEKRFCLSEKLIDNKKELQTINDNIKLKVNNHYVDLDKKYYKTIYSYEDIIAEIEIPNKEIFLEREFIRDGKLNGLKVLYKKNNETKEYINAQLYENNIKIEDSIENRRRLLEPYIMSEEEKEEWINIPFIEDPNYISKNSNENIENLEASNNKVLYIILPIIGVLVLGVILYFAFFKENNDYQEVSTQSTTSYSQPQAQQEEVKTTVVENNNVNNYIPTVEDARYVNYKTYYNDNFDYSIDYPDDEYFQISKTYEDGMKLQNDNGEVLISLTSNWNPNGESLQQAYDKAVREKPNAPYKFLGKTFFTITYEDNGILVFRKTMYDKNTNKYVYLYVSFPPEYKDYMTPIVERMANSMKKSVSNVTSTANNSYSDSQLENKFGRVVKDKYVGGSFIEFLRNANENEYYYLRDQFWEILNTMYVTEDNKTYYYLNDIIDQLETKADWDNSSRVISLEVKGNKMYYTVGFPKGYNANTPSWVQFEIFERKFNDGIGLRTAHVSCAINGVEYKDWDAVYAIFR